MKTLVAAKHHSERGAWNGDGGCHARLGQPDNACPGKDTAAWLNGLGEDDEAYGGLKGITCGQVRDNWLRGSDHIIAVFPELARLQASKRRLQGELRLVNKLIKRYEQER